MLQTLTGPVRQNIADERRQRSTLTWLAWFLGILLLSGGLGALMLTTQPDASIVGWLIFVIGAVAIVYQPRFGVYLIIFFGLVGDTALIPWYPFAKDFSSVESLLYVNHSIKFSPLEVYILLIFASWLVRGVVQRNLRIHTGQLGWPALVFFGFTVFGLAYGLATHGDSTVALWEARPVVYLVAMVVLASNLLETREHVSHVLWLAMVALLIVGIIGDWYYFVVLKGDLTGIESITEHGTAIQINTLFVFAIGAFIYKVSPGKRLVLVAMIAVVAVTYIAAQRRAAFLSLIIAVLLMLFLLYRDKRRLFWLIIPPAAVLGLVYVAVYWNSGSRLALPVEAIKSVFSQDLATARDQASNNYRILENADTSFTIHQHPLTGVGFGQPFSMVVPLPDISFFVWWRYITHNSVLWIWMKTGAGGFFALLFLVGLSVITGTQAIRRMPDDDLKVAATVATFYIVMHFTYAYVDMSWDARSTLYVGTMMGLINCLELIAARSGPAIRRRWPRQFGRTSAPVVAYDESSRAK